MSKEKKSICLISPSLQMGGLERAMCSLANYFDSKGYKVYYIVLYRFEKFYTLNDGISFIEPKRAYGGSKAVYYAYLLSYIRKRVKECQPDTILSFGDYHNALVLLALKGLNIPIYISDRSSPDLHFSNFMKIFRKWLYKSSTGIIAQTERAAMQKKNMLGKNFNITVIPNAIRQIRRYPIDRKKYILGVGRHAYVKGFDRLINAYARLDTDWKLVLAGGGGGESENLKRQVKMLNIEDRVVFLGKVVNIDEVYSEAGIFCLTSRSEGFPNALCEAMAAGLPCIGFDISAGPSDIIENNENGILVEDGNIDQFVNNLSALLSDASLRQKLGNNALGLQKKLSFEASGEKFLKTITSHL